MASQWFSLARGTSGISTQNKKGAAVKAKILDGKVAAAAILAELDERVTKLATRGVVP